MEINQLTILVATFAGSALATMVLMPWILYLCHKHQLTYETDDKYHFRIPRLGGIIFVPTMCVGMSIAFAMRIYNGQASDTLKYSTSLIACGAMVVALLGIVDDIFGLSRRMRRLLLLVASLVLPLCGLYVNNLHGLFGIYEINATAGILITILFTVLTIKGIESLKDIDGLAGVIGLVPLLVFGIVFLYMGYYSYTFLAFSMIASLLVFLYYNVFGDERIGTKAYIGRTGIYLIGYCIVYLSLKYAMDNRLVFDEHADALLLPYSLLVLPVFEYIRVSLKSSWGRLSKEKSKRLKISNVLFRKGFSHLQVTGIILLGDIIIIAVNMMSHYLLGLDMTWILLLNIVIYIILQMMVERKIKPVPQKPVAPLDFAGYRGKEGLVSVIMSTYNSSRFVGESIESIMAQTYKNWELIITDDCSTDNSREILKAYAAKDPRIKVQFNETNGGAGVSRDMSIAKASGRYIAFCDSDDRWVADKLEKQLNYMKEKGISLCFAPYYTCDENSQYLGYVSAPLRVNIFDMMCDNKMGFLTCIYDTKTLGKHPMPKQRKRQDHALLLHLLKICHYAYSVPEPMAHYRLHPRNMSSNKIGLIKYNAHTYTEVFGWPKPLSYAFLFAFFMPTYFYKRVKNILINVARAA